MARVFSTFVRSAVLVCAAALLLLPGTASAAPHWQKPATAPGGDDIVVWNGAPVLAYTAADGVHVVRGSNNGKRWQPVGAPVRHVAGAPVFDPSLAVDPRGRLWIAWTETDARPNRPGPARQARVARFDGRTWREVVGGDRPLNDHFGVPEGGPYDDFPDFAFNPTLAFHGGRVYAAFVETAPSDDVLVERRLSADGSRWEGLRTPVSEFLIRPARAQLVVSGGRLYLGAEDVLIPTAGVLRLDPASDVFLQLHVPNSPTFAHFDAIADLGGAPAVLFTRVDDTGESVEVRSLGADDVWQPVGAPLATNGDGQDLAGRYVAWLENGGLRTAYLSGGRWRPIAVPGNPSATSAKLATSGRDTWLLWQETGGAWRVARLAGG